MLTFKLVSDSVGVVIESVENELEIEVGRILWNPFWNSYVFHPGNSMFDSNELKEIVNHVDELLLQRKN